MNINGNLIKHSHIFNWISHRQSAHRTKQMSLAILIIYVLFSQTFLVSFSAWSDLDNRCLKDTTNIRLSALWLTFNSVSPLFTLLLKNCEVQHALQDIWCDNLIFHCRVVHSIRISRVLNASLQFLQSAHAAPANRSWPQSKLLAISSNCEALCESIVYCQHFTMIEKIKRQAGLWWFSKCILDVSWGIHYMDYHIKY